MCKAERIVTEHGITYFYNPLAGRFKYTLVEDAAIHVPGINFGKFKAKSRHDGKIYIEVDGSMFIVRTGYSWDGCTYAPEAHWNMRASLFHDAMYQVKKCGLPINASWYQIDEIFRQNMKQDGANMLQRNLYYYAVRSLGAPFKLEKFDSLIKVDF